MKQKRNYTLTEQEENKIVNQIYNKKILLIKKLLETCHLTVMDLCVHLNIDTSTFHRWFQPNPCIISALKYTQVCVFFGQYIKCFAWVAGDSCFFWEVQPFRLCFLLSFIIFV